MKRKAWNNLIIGTNVRKQARLVAAHRRELQLLWERATIAEPVEPVEEKTMDPEKNNVIQELRTEGREWTRHINYQFKDMNDRQVNEARRSDCGIVRSGLEVFSH